LHRIACLVAAKPIRKLPVNLFLNAPKINAPYHSDIRRLTGQGDFPEQVTLAHEGIDIICGQRILKKIDNTTGIDYQRIASGLQHILNNGIRIVIPGVRLAEYGLKYSQGPLIPQPFGLDPNRLLNGCLAHNRQGHHSTSCKGA
jgi:hypothetical protein